MTDLQKKATRAQPPIDIEACLTAASREARQSVPARPVETTSPFDYLQAATLDITETYDMALKHMALKRFNEELQQFEDELRGWLEAYDNRRWPRSQQW